MATLIATQAASGIQPRSIHAGVQSVYSVYSLTATLSSGDVIQMCKLPDNARVVDYFFETGALLGTACKLNVGSRANPDALIASATTSVAIRVKPSDATFAASGGIGTVFDVSGTATTVTPYTMMEVTVSDGAGSTSTGWMALTVCYSVDQG